MDLSFNIKMEAYYQKFYELQEKLRKSEEERLKLEMKFNELVRISKEEEQAHYKKLRSQYKRFLEEDRKRQERNEKIIRTLERIEARVNMLASKTERIKMLRHQYQSYLQRVSQKPATKQDYTPSKITEEPPCNQHQPVFDYDKKSSDIAMLKKAYGKTNDEKIEILDKYLQSLKSQKSQTVTETKPKESTTDFSNELKYLDEVSKKFNEGFSSNEANSIAEDIMNSIYARHYKTDSFKNEPKKVSKFTSPNYTTKQPDPDRSLGFGDSPNQLQNCRNYSVDKHNGDLKKYDIDYRINGTSKFNENPYNMSKGVVKNIPSFERQTDFNRTYENVLRNNVESFSSKQPYQENRNITNSIPEVYNNKEKMLEQFSEDVYGPSKTEMDLIEKEKDITYNPTTTEMNWGEVSVMNNEIEVQPTFNEAGKEYDVNNSAENAEFWNEESKEILNAPKDEFYNSKEFSTVPQNQFKDTMAADNEIYESEAVIPYQNQDEVPYTDSENQPIFDGETKNNEPSEEIVDTIEIYENKLEPKGIEENTDNELPYYAGDEQQVEYDNNQIMYEESSQPLQTQHHEEHEQQYQQINQYDSRAQPMEQLHSGDSKAMQQYDENQDQAYQYDDGNSQQMLEEKPSVVPQDTNAQDLDYDGKDQTTIEYNENSEFIEQYNEDQPVQHYDDNDQSVQQYEENSRLVEPSNDNVKPVEMLDHQPTEPLDETAQFLQQHDENSQPIQPQHENVQPTEHYDEKSLPVQQENDQPFQQYDESGQPLQQLIENDQPTQQFDENGQPVQQYDENGQPIQLYDEYGQPLQQYNENEQYQNSQPVQQYDEYGQPMQQYDENGQLIQQYDENGQPLPQYDENGQPIQGYDENGQPVYFTEAEQYDENGQIQQYDNTGQVYDESYQHYDANGQPATEYQDQLPKEFDENGQTLEQYDTSQHNEADQQEQHVEAEVKDGGDSKEDDIKLVEAEGVNQALKKKNVLDLLDTDSESVKQNTSKISNDSDFDFSNG